MPNAKGALQLFKEALEEGSGWLRGTASTPKGLFQSDEHNQSTITNANAVGGVWMTKSPLVAESYAGRQLYPDIQPPPGVVIPLELLDKNPVRLDAKGAWWDEYFFGHRLGLAGLLGLAEEKPLPTKLRPGMFKEAFEDPAVKSIILDNIGDPGPFLWKSKPNGTLDVSDLMADKRVSPYIATNAFVKDPTLLRPWFSDEPLKSFDKYAKGGLAQASGGAHG